jgi:hypothetical protein
MGHLDWLRFILASLPVSDAVRLRVFRMFHRRVDRTVDLLVSHFIHLRIGRVAKRSLARPPRRESSLHCEEERHRRDAHDRDSEPAQRADKEPGPVFAHDLVVVRDVHNQGEQRRAQAADDAWKRVTSLFRENL